MPNKSYKVEKNLTLPGLKPKKNAELQYSALQTELQHWSVNVKQIATIY